MDIAEFINRELPFMAQLLLNGLSVGAIYVLLALSITLVFGLTNIVLFAQGEMMVLGSYLAFTVFEATGTWWLGVIAAVLLLGVVSFGLEEGLFRFTISQPMNGFIISFGLIILLQNVFTRVWGANPVRVDPLIAGSWAIGGLRVVPQRMLTLIISSVTLAVVLYVVKRTSFGRALRACSQDFEAARLMGIRARRIIATTFVIGGMITGICGALLISQSSVTPFTGVLYIIRAFAIAIVGGLGSVGGTLVVGMGLGVSESLAEGYFPLELRDAFVFTLVLLVLLLRPQGLFGQRGRYV